MKIIKKNKGDKTYFYLKHSFRKKGDIINKEKYLGKEIPANISLIVKEFREEFNSGLNEKLLLIKKHFQAEWTKIPQSSKEKELKEIAIAFTYNTNALEGSTITLEETREILEEKIAPNRFLRDIKETEAHNNVFLEMLKKKEKISVPLLIDWHQKIFGETKSDISGKFREHLVRVGSYLAPDWQEVEKMMKNIIAFISKEQKNMNPVELSARVHYRFEKIHPFADGNGRIGRLLINYMLWHSSYPMLIIEDKRKKSYYKALTREEEKFVRYFIRRYLAVHERRYLRK